MDPNKDKLIQKILSGTATDADRAEFESWVSSDPTNAVAYEEIKLLFEASLNIEEKMEERSPQFYEGLTNIQHKIMRLKRRRRTVPFVVAGGIAMIVVSSVLFFSQQATLEQYAGADKHAVQLTENLSFDNETLKDITTILAERYDLMFSVSSKGVLACRFTGTFYKGMTIDDLMRTLAQSEGFEYKVLNRQTYELLGDGCQL